MKVRLIDVDSKIPNLALMKISAYHKSKNHDVDFYNPLFDCNDTDLIYSSKIFDYTEDYKYYPKDVKIIKGGSGYSLKTELPEEIEKQFPDYSLYDYKKAIGFSTRGCIRDCDFCIVREKEGDIRAVKDIYDFWNGQKEIMLLDNNLTSHRDHFKLILNQLIKEKIKVDFRQGLDIRLLTDEQAYLLSKVKLSRHIRFAFDDIKLEEEVKRGIKLLNENGVKSYKLFFYVLIGYNSTKEEDLYRVNMLENLGVEPFVMPFDKSDPYQKDFARWVNHKAIFRSCKWNEYKKQNY